MDKRSYRVTDKAGPRVNGARVVVGQLVEMTLTQAAYYLDLGEIELVKKPKA
jgi:hypothetical protein